jgi:hypothetical protein
MGLGLFGILTVDDEVDLFLRIKSTEQGGKVLLLGRSHHHDHSTSDVDLINQLRRPGNCLTNG